MKGAGNEGIGTMSAWSAGCARTDITGEPWGTGMMGYGVPGQWSQGIITRQFARAYVFDDGTRCLAWVVADIGMFFQAAVDAVAQRLMSASCGRFESRNIILTATHTHCGPGGHGHHLLYNITTSGFHRRTFARLVDGVVNAVLRADSNRENAELHLAQGSLTTASVNRSPSAFERNPDEDRLHHPQLVDPMTTLLTITSSDRLRGAINWFAVHNTSMSNRTTSISSDNKGWAARQWENELGEDFVPAFAQTNAGDISPNLGGRERCGPTSDERVNNRLIAERQLEAAQQLLAADMEPLDAVVDYRLRYIDLHRKQTGAGPTSSAVLGASFAAGTTDGLGSPLFRQGKHNRFFDRISQALYRLHGGLARSQAPKDLALPVGRLGWAQQRLPVQLVRLGSLYLICLPVEVTITSGLRLRRSAAHILDTGLEHVLVQGYSNGYAHYLTTDHEYDEQRYEGGSTIFGRHQLRALIETVGELAEAMIAGEPVDPGTPPPQPHVIIPAPTGSPLWSRHQPVTPRSWPGSAHSGQPVVAEFTSDHPNDPIRDTYLLIERQRGHQWDRVADDASLNTRIRWRRERGRFIARIVWEIPGDADGRYRIGYVAAKHTVHTPPFAVIPAPG